MINAGSVIKEFLQRRVRTKEEVQESIAYTRIWRQVIGKNIEKRTRPVALKNGVLFIEVEDSVWLYQLTLLKDKIINDFNSHTVEALITDIIFRNMGISLLLPEVTKKTLVFPEKKDLPRQKPKLITDKMDTAEKETVEKIASAVQGPLREKMHCLLNSYYLLQHWKKKQGAKICPSCRALFLERNENRGKESICVICQRETKVEKY
jgi:predicted nucleic acid-binding Zn ribbon protein